MSPPLAPNRQMHELGMLVHGVLAAFHFLGLVYNARRRNWSDVACHTAALCYDAHAVTRHLGEVRREG